MRRVLVDAGVFIRLAGTGRIGLLRRVGGRVEMPAVVQLEVADSTAAGVLERAVSGGTRWIRTARDPADTDVRSAAELLGRDGTGGALGAGDPVVVTDDAPLARTCRALGIPISGSIGVVISAVERGDLDPDGASDALVAMDEVGPRVSARLLRRAERLVAEAAEGQAGTG